MRSRDMRFFIRTAFVAATCFPALAGAQEKPTHEPVALPTGVQIVSRAGEPELRIDGVPFFVHAAQFDYFRIPSDLWFRSLDRYRELGINTIDLRIPWNWHEIGDGEFDFDGHTNPRRDLQTLLLMIADKHMKIIARPGPLIGDHWRNAGYPAWLLRYSDYKMHESESDAGLAPRDAEVATRDGNEAARDWLANETHMTYARRWLTTIARVLAPFSSRKKIPIKELTEREGESQEKEISGPLLFVVLDDGVAVPAGSGAPDLSRYLSELRGALARGRLDADTFVNVPDIVAQGAPSFSTASTTAIPNGLGLTGEWYFEPSKGAVLASGVDGSSSKSHNQASLTTRGASTLSFLANSLRTQPDFPPILSGFATTRFAPAGDIRAPQPPSENMLLASRIIFGSGVHGITYSPIQDTLTPE